MKRRFHGKRSTPGGQHRPVMLDEALAILEPRPGQVAVDCTVGWAGHSSELLARVGPGGKLIGIDLDVDHLPTARTRLEKIGGPFHLHHGNFAALQGILSAEAGGQCDLLIADLGMSSLQLDDAGRGFSYVRDGPLDMRMDRSRGRTAAELLVTISRQQLAAALTEFGDEPQANEIAAAIVAARKEQTLTTTAALKDLIVQTVGGGDWRLHPSRGKWNVHPAARTFQALRILVNRELNNLEALLRQLPLVLRPGGTAAIISFHSGEDRLVKSAFKSGKLKSQYSPGSDEPLRPSWRERQDNPRSRSAKMRWVRRA